MALVSNRNFVDFKSQVNPRRFAACIVNSGQQGDPLVAFFPLAPGVIITFSGDIEMVSIAGSVVEVRMVDGAREYHVTFNPFTISATTAMFNALNDLRQYGRITLTMWSAVTTSLP